MALTKRQKEVLDFIKQFVDREGYSPSYEEIGFGLRLASTATVHKHISALEKKQYLRRSYNQSRSLEVTNKYYNELRRIRQSEEPVMGMVPLMGRIAAGQPVEAVQGQDTLQFSDFVGSTETFALQVRGDSMIDAHICDGDFVLVERAGSVRDGDIVVALVSGSDATLKRWFQEPNDVVRLQPENTAMEPIRVPAGQVEVQGKLLAVMRKYR